MLAVGIVSRSKGSPWAAPLHLFKKQEGGWRPCGDFRGLNLKTTADSCVVPNLHGLNYNLKGKQVFSRLDLVKGYFQVPVHKDSRAKIAVVTPF